MKTTTPNPTLAVFDSEGSGVDTYLSEVIGVDWSGPGAVWVAVCGHLCTRPAA